MRVAIVAVALALVLPAAAVADAPARFTEAKSLDPIASFVAGKPVHVWCATSQDGWDASRPDGLEAQYGFAVIGGVDESLSTYACRTLETGVAWAPFAAVLLTLVHESVHLSGVADETTTDCLALHKLAQVAILYFGYKPRTAKLRALVAEATRDHKEKPASYRAHAC